MTFVLSQLWDEQALVNSFIFPGFLAIFAQMTMQMPFYGLLRLILIKLILNEARQFVEDSVENPDLLLAQAHVLLLLDG